MAIPQLVSIQKNSASSIMDWVAEFRRPTGYYGDSTHNVKRRTAAGRARPGADFKSKRNRWKNTTNKESGF
jgi:hypothetical protein